MRILIVSPQTIYPPVSGGAVRKFSIIKGLSEDNEVHLIIADWFDKGSYEEKLEGAISLRLLKYCKKSYLFSLAKVNPKKFWSEYYKQGTFKNAVYKKLGDSINEIIKSNSIDMVQLEHIQLAKCVDHIRGAPVVLTEYEVDNILRDRTFLKRADRQEIKRYHRNAYRKFSGVICMSRQEEKRVRKFLNVKGGRLVRTLAAPTSVSDDFFSGNRGYRDKGLRANIVYIGDYRHKPNEDAALHFVKDILPFLRKKIKGLRVFIVGPNPTKAMGNLKRRDIIVTGAVSCVKKYLKKASVFAAPIRLGGGIRGKLLEAFAMKVPVVASSWAAGSIDGVVPGKHLLVADSAESFSGQVLKLLHLKSVRTKIVENASTLAEKCYNWNIQIKKLNKFYNSIISQISRRQG